MKKVDFHIHTIPAAYESDFHFSLEVLLNYVQDKALDAIAITNHNLFNLSQYKEIAKTLSITVYPGIEIDIEGGHLLLITSVEDLEDFTYKCSQITDINSTESSCIDEAELKNIFGNLDKYILIPHYGKDPVLDLEKAPDLQPYIKCGEVSSVKKFLAHKKDPLGLSPVLFSDLRIEEGVESFPDKQTYIDVGEISFNAIKYSLSDKTKVSLAEDDGHILFTVLDNGLKISNGLTVVLGERSSGKTHTLNAINDTYEHATYIRQFELLSSDESKEQKEFDDLLRHKGESVFQDFFTPLRDVVDSVDNINLKEDAQKVENYITHLKQAAAEAEKKDIFAKSKMFSENIFEIKDVAPLEDLILSLDKLIENVEYQEIINKYISRKSLLLLAVALREQVIKENTITMYKNYINDIVYNIKNDLQSRSANTMIPDVDFYDLLMNKQKVDLFENIILNLKEYEHPIEERNIHLFKIIASIKPFSGASEIRKLAKTSEECSSLFQKYMEPKPYEYLCALREKSFVEPSELYKFFVKTQYEVLNRYGEKVSGGERSEFYLLQKLQDAIHEDILIMDEPESSFDNPFLKSGVNSLLKKIARTTPVVIATHNNTMGASINPDYLIYTKKEVSKNGNVIYHLFSGYPSEEYLTDLEGKKVSRKEIMLNCLEAGEQAYIDRRAAYEISDN